MNDLLREVRRALRSLERRPLFTAVAVASLAIGLGATTTIAGVVEALLLRPPAGVAEPERVVEVGRTDEGHGFDTLSYPELVDLRERVPALDRVAGWSLAPMSFSSGGPGERVDALAVSAEYFEVLGVRPRRGRFFSPREEAAGELLAVVSHRFWRQRLGGDPEVVGRTLDLNRRPFTVVGVAPPGFHGHLPVLPPDLYVPLRRMDVARPGFDEIDERGASWLQVLGRRAPGAGIGEVDAQLAALFAALRDEVPVLYGGDRGRRSARAEPLGTVMGAVRGPVEGFLAVLGALVVVVLLVTCANVAGMLLARAAGREKEVGIRLALGARRGQLVRHLLAESLLLFGLGGAAGVGLSWWGSALLSRLSLPLPVTFEIDLRPDARVLVFGLLLAAVTGLVFGMVPALAATRPELLASLREAARARGARGHRLRRAFVAAQVGLSLVLLLAAGLFLRSLETAAAVDRGFVADGVETMALDLSLDGYGASRGRRFVAALEERLGQAPGVAAAALASDLPLDLNARESPFYPGDHGEDGVQAAFDEVSPGYFAAAGIAVRRGRGFTAADRDGAEPVVVVSRRLAETAWPQGDPVGRRLRFGDADAAPATVIGVVDDVKNQTLMESPEPMLYLPLAQRWSPELTLLVRSAAPPGDVAERMRREIRALDPRLSLTPVRSLAEVTRLGTLPQRLAAVLTSALGLLALLLSALGVYGVVAFTVARRRREIGVRMALGSGRVAVRRLVVAGALRLVLPGVALGGLAGLGLSWVMRRFLLGLAPADPVTFAAVPALLVAVVAAASWLPARRAARVDPMEALRAE